MPHCLDVRLIDDGKVVSPTHRPRSTPQKHYFSASDTHFFSRLSKPQDLVRPGRLGKSNIFFHLIGSGTRDVRTCSILRCHVPPYGSILVLIDKIVIIYVIWLKMFPSLQYDISYSLLCRRPSLLCHVYVTSDARVLVITSFS
jgi:hypothetical protein